MGEARKLFPDRGVTCCDNLPMALAQTDAVAVVTLWEAFSQVPPNLRMQKPQPIVVDGRRAFSKASIPRYEGIGL